MDKWTKASAHEKFEGAHEQMNDSSENLLETPRHPTNFPDLSIIGRAFDDAIAVLRSEQHENLNKAAAEWIQAETVKILQQLKYQLAKLERCKSDPLSLPPYAICPEKSLSLYIGSSPVLLAMYTQDFTDYFQDFLQSCGFTVEVRSYLAETSHPYIIANIFFPKVSKKKETPKQALELSAVKANAAGLVKEFIVVQEKLNEITEIESDD